MGENQTTEMNFANDFRIEPSQTFPRYKFYEFKLSENNNTNKLLSQFMGNNEFNGINFNQLKNGGKGYNKRKTRKTRKTKKNKKV